MAHAADKTKDPPVPALNVYKICLGSRIPHIFYYRKLVSSDDL